MADSRKGLDELVFVALGGAGEIGMNLNLYGYGPPDSRQWLMVDCGITFGHEDTPGVDVIMPDSSFIVANRRNLLGMVLTHAHEDHIGAVAYLWPELRCPIYATPFTAALLRNKLEDAGLLEEAKLRIVPMDAKFTLGPFEIQLITITHSIPEPNAIAIRTKLGTILHTGDWKIDPEPLIGEVTDERALRQLGEDGVLAMVCDSTNALVEGESGSEADVRKNLEALIRPLKNRVAVTAFASNVARVESIVLAGHECGREVALVGRSMLRIVQAARETGFLKDLPPLIPVEEAIHLPRSKVLYCCTGSQGEWSAALTRIARGDHPDVTLEAGDAVIYSSRIIPGNERAIFEVHNMLAAEGVEILTERDHFVHVSGHPARAELAKMYQWVRPQISIPVHGEMRHLTEHARFARELQVPQAFVAPNGTMLRLAPGPAARIDEVPVGRLFRDGAIIVRDGDGAVRARKGLAFAGFVGVTLVLDHKNRFAADPVLHCEGVPDEAVKGLMRAAEEVAGKLSPRQLDSDSEIEDVMRRALRREAQSVWGKKPITRVQIVRLDK